MARILLLTPQLPYPPQQGTSLRNFHMLKALAQKHQVTLLSFTEAEDLSEDNSPLNDLCRVLPSVPVPIRSTGARIKTVLTTSLPDIAFRLKSDDFSAALAEALAEPYYDAVQVEGIELASYIDLIRSCSPDTQIVLDCHNAETELQRRAFQSDLHRISRWPAGVYSFIRFQRLTRFERGVLAEADSIIAVSETDRDQFMKLIKRDYKEVRIIPNTIDITEYTSPPLENEHIKYDLVFTGKMDYRPNIDGVLWFAETVWPLIQDQRPQTTLAIVGQRPHHRLAGLQQGYGITITGRVPKVQPYLHGASIFIVPLRIGSGTRLKILEAMAAGKPVVSTSVGAEGFDVSDGEDIIIADTPEDWASAILRLLNNPGLRKELGSAAKDFSARYDWRHIVPLLSTIYPD